MGNTNLLQDPNTSLDNANWTFTGGSTVAGVLAGGTDSTYAVATASNGTSTVDYTDVSIPTGAQIRSVTLVFRALSSGGYFSVGVIRYGMISPKMLTAGTKSPGSATNYSWTMPLDPAGQAWNASSVNTLSMILGANTGVRVIQSRIEVLYNEMPAISAVTVSGTSARPVVSYTFTDPGGNSGIPDAQERLIVRVFADYVAAAAGFNPETNTRAVHDSGVVYSSAPTYTLTTSLPPGGYVFYVKASDAGSNGRYSLWASSSYAVAGTPPASPTLVSAVTNASSGYNVITAAQNDNLMSYNQGSFELSDGTGWYIDSNVSALATAATAATNVEGSKVLAMTCTSASTAKIRSGGTWATAGLGGSQNLQIRTWQFAARNSDNTNASVTIAAASGSTLFAFTTDDTSAEGSVTVSSAPSLTWTLVKRQGSADSGQYDAVTIYKSSATSATTYTVQTNSSNWVPSIGVAEITGAAASPVGASGGGGTVGTVNASYASTAAGSWGFLVYADWSALAIPSPDANSIRLAGVTSGSPNTSMVMRRTSPTSLSGQTVNLTTTNPTGGVTANYAYVEVLPATTPPGVPATSLAGIPVVAGAVYTKFASCWISSPANTVRNVRVDCEWYDVTGTIISTTAGSNFATVAGNLLAAQSETVTAPASAVCAVLVPQTVDAPAATNVYHWDRMGLTLGASARWFRGGMQTRNLLTCDQGSLQNSIGGWTVLLSAAAYTTTDRFAYVNVKSGQVLRTYVSSQPKTAAAQTGQILAAEPGTTYTAYALAITAAGTPNGWLSLNFENAQGQSKGSALGSQVTLGTAAWQLLTVTGTMPLDATAARLQVNASLAATGTGNAVYWTRLGIGLGSSAPSAWQPGPTPNTFPLVESSDDGGVTWVQVRGCDAVNFDPTTWQAVVNDYEAPSNATRLYRVSTAGLDYGIDPLGFYTVSAPSGTASLTLPVTDFYLVDSYVPSRFFMEQEGEVDFVEAEPQTVYAPLGRSTEMVTYDRPKSKHFTMKLGMLNGAEFDAVGALRDSGHVLFMQTPYPRSWYVKLGPNMATKWLISPDVTGRFDVTVELIEVARPD